MSDLLSQFRKKPIENVHATLSTEEPAGYVAFHARDRVERLKIRRANAPARAPGYAYMLDIVSDPPYGTKIALVFSFMVVTIKGKNLQAVVLALESGTADFIQEFDRDQWKQPKDGDAPFIDSIEVIVKERGPSAEDMGATEPDRSTGKPH